MIERTETSSLQYSYKLYFFMIYEIALVFNTPIHLYILICVHRKKPGKNSTKMLTVVSLGVRTVDFLSLFFSSYLSQAKFLYLLAWLFHWYSLPITGPWGKVPHLFEPTGIPSFCYCVWNPIGSQYFCMKWMNQPARIIWFLKEDGWRWLW